MPVTNKPKNKLEVGTFLLVGLSVLALAACTVITWFSLGQGTYTTKIATEISQQQAALVAQSSQNKVPTLILNQNNTQEGPTVTVNPQNLGKTNPFTLQ